MPPAATTPKLPSPRATSVTTTCFVSNLHCSSCAEVIRVCLSALEPAPDDIFVSILSHSVVVRHSAFLDVDSVLNGLETAGFEVHSVFQGEQAVQRTPEVGASDQKSKEWYASLEDAVSRWVEPASLKGSQDEMRKRDVHLEQCEQCKTEGGGVCLEITSDEKLPPKSTLAVSSLERTSFDATPSLSEKSPISSDIVVVDSQDDVQNYKATLAISGMTCSSCVSAITHAAEQLSWVLSIHVNLLTNSAVVTFSGRQRCEELIATIEDCGFDVTVETLEEVQILTSKPTQPPKQNPERWRATYAIGGMTCSSCVAHITEALDAIPWIEQVQVNLVSNSATITFSDKEHLSDIKECIEEIGFEATLDQVTKADTPIEMTAVRTVGIRIEGMFCHHCPGNIAQGLYDTYGRIADFEIDDARFSTKSPIVYVKYRPSPPQFTIRDIFATIKILNPVFRPSVYHPPTIEERAQEMHRQERKRILFRLVLCVIIAIPTFILGIVFMSLVKSKHPIRKYLMGKMWVGNATRLTWALFILATPIYFFAADIFHRRAFKELRAMWRPGSRTPLLHRFVRFGSMNMLISLGTTIAYFASVVELALAATKKSKGSMTDTYFDVVVFLTMFLLIGRFIEAYSKAKTGDAVTSLGKLRPKEAIFVDYEKGDIKIATDLLDVGDIVRIHHGTSPPFDGVVLDGTSSFDESSLTGESRPVKKFAGDVVYSGTVNKGAPIKIRLTTISGTSMLDQIINAVREGQTRRAPVERVADTITSHFVPFVIAISISTWLIWLILGTTGGIPKNWKNNGAGGWALWSLRFAIATIVIACPCGIGLAAPTALFVGGGLAAKHGILVKGGGEAFQEASSLDCIVFDKTGTLTQGGDPQVTSHMFAGCQNEKQVLGFVKALEDNSNHPIARALVSFCNEHHHDILLTTNVDEVPGKGLKGTFKVDGQEITAIIGNESFMADHHVSVSRESAVALHHWKSQGQSVALIALMQPLPTAKINLEHSESSSNSPASTPVSTTPNTVPAVTTITWELACAFAISDPLRSEAAGVIAALKERGIDVWMLSGDNPITANAVGAQVGIPTTNIIAGVLPDQKAEKIKYLQQTLTKPRASTLFRIPLFSRRTKTPKRATIAMVGDGINDAPALSTADLSIAIGSGSDIAISSSSFILITSHLTTILTLLDLSRVVFRRVYFNFGWALIYNMLALPVAAGVLFPITTGVSHMEMHHNGIGMEMGMAMESSGVKHVRLDPVWASLAMALSSISVVCSSLALRSGVPGVGFRIKKEAGSGESVEKKEADMV